jgi:hypothetical protein
MTGGGAGGGGWYSRRSLVVVPAGQHSRRSGGASGLERSSLSRLGLPATACVSAPAKPVSSPLASVSQANRSIRFESRDSSAT